MKISNRSILIISNGLFTLFPIKIGEIIDISLNTVGDYVSINEYINHSDNPNAIVKDDIIAIKNISPNTEITINYQQFHNLIKSAKNKFLKKKEEESGNITYIYSQKHIQERNKKKAARIEKLSKNIDKVRHQAKKDVSSADPNTKYTALAVLLMDETYERVGNVESSREMKHYGVTTWLVKHVKFGKGATISYMGKSGVKQKKDVKDKTSVRLLKELTKNKSPNDRIFVGDDYFITPVKINKYLHNFSVTAKDIRGFHANDEMREKLQEVRKSGPALPKDTKEKETLLKKEFKAALEETAKKVGHKASTLKNQYLVPGMFQTYVEKGTVIKNLTKGASERPSQWKTFNPISFIPQQQNPPPGFDFDFAEGQKDTFQYDTQDITSEGNVKLDKSQFNFLVDSAAKLGIQIPHQVVQESGNSWENVVYSYYVPKYITDKYNRKVSLGKILSTISRYYRKQDNQENLKKAKEIFHVYETTPIQNWQLIISAEPSDIMTMSGPTRDWASCMAITKDPYSSHCEKEHTLQNAISSRDLIAYAVPINSNKWVARVWLRYDGHKGWWPEAQVYGNPATINYEDFLSAVEDYLKSHNVRGETGKFSPFAKGWSDWQFEQGEESESEGGGLIKQPEEPAEKETPEIEETYKGTGAKFKEAPKQKIYKYHVIYNTANEDIDTEIREAVPSDYRILFYDSHGEMFITTRHPKELFRYIKQVPDVKSLELVSETTASLSFPLSKRAATEEEEEMTVLFQVLSQVIEKGGGFKNLSPEIQEKVEKAADALWNNDMRAARKLVWRLDKIPEFSLSKRAKLEKTPPIATLFHHLHHDVKKDETKMEHEEHHCGGEPPGANYTIKHCEHGKHAIDKENAIGHATSKDLKPFEVKIHFSEPCEEGWWHIESGKKASSQEFSLSKRAILQLPNEAPQIWSWVKEKYAQRVLFYLRYTEQDDIVEHNLFKRQVEKDAQGLIFSKTLSAKKIFQINWNIYGINSKQDIVVVIKEVAIPDFAGLWSQAESTLYIYISPSSFIQNDLIGYNTILDDLKTTLAHELRHATQSIISKPKGGLPKYISPTHDPSGHKKEYEYLLTRPIEEWTDIDWKNLHESNKEQLPHALRDIEYHTNLNDSIIKFRKIKDKLPETEWVWAAKVFVGHTPIFRYKGEVFITDTFFNELKRDAKIKSKILNPTKQQKREAYIARLKYNTAVKQFYKEVL